MNNAPAVYVPTQPEGNGLTMPMLLSLLAHGIILGVLIYTYQTPTLEIAGSIETTMVTPGELAEIQGQILANRAAAAEQAASASSSASAEMQMNESDSDAADQNSAEQSSQQVPVFTRSDESSSSSNRPLLMSEIQQQRLLEQTQEYERNIARAAADLDGTQALDDFKQQQRNERVEEDDRLKNYQAKGAQPVRNERPDNSQPRVIKNSNGLGITSGGRNDTNPTASPSLNMATDGEENGFSSANNPNAGGGGPSKSTSDSKILSLIRQNLSSPTGGAGTNVETLLTITVDSSGIITNVVVEGKNPRFDEAVKLAVERTYRLPIGPNDTKYPTFKIRYKGKA